MTVAASQLLEQVLLLPEEEREEILVNVLHCTLPPAAFVAEQMKAVRRRMEDVRDGRSRLIPAEEAHRQVRESLRAKA